MKLLLTVLSAAVLAILSLPGYALTLDPGDFQSCGTAAPDVTNNVQDNLACFVFNGTDNLDENLVVGGNTTTFLDKDESTAEVGGGLTLTGDTKNGTWSIDNYDPLKDYILVFKDGQNALPGAQIVYLLDGSSGTYTSPFYNEAEGTTQKDISFWALHEIDGDGPIRTPRENPPPSVPLPAGVILLGTGVAALAINRKRKRRAA